MPVLGYPVPRESGQVMDAAWVMGPAIGQAIINVWVLEQASGQAMSMIRGSEYPGGAGHVRDTTWILVRPLGRP